MTQIIEFKIKQIVPEATDAITLILEEVNQRVISYQAGQFLTIIVHINGKELRRSYSICTTPNVDSYLAITIKRIVNGEVSRYLIDNLREGDILQTLPPAGRFTLETNPDNQRDLFLIGAGSGMTPLFSHLKNLLYNEPQSRINLICSNKSEKFIFYFNQLRQLEKEFVGNLEILHFLGDPGDEFRHLLGRLNIGLLEEIIRKRIKHEKSTAQFLICGPFTFMRMVRMTLIFMGFVEDQIHQEHFVSKINDTPKAPLSHIEDRTVKLVFNNQETALKVRAGETILNEALANGIPLGYNCKAGVCSTCIGRCTSGKVHMIYNEVLTEKEVREGLMLTCMSYPETDDVVIRIN